MNEKQFSITHFNSPLWGDIIKYNDDRIYNDSKGRPVGLASRVSRVTNNIENPANIPLMTPEDRMYLNACFEKCLDNARQFLLATK